MIRYYTLVTLALLLLIGVGALLVPKQAVAGVSCHTHDHYHQGRTVKHDRRYKYQSNGYIWVRWDIKLRQPSGFYHRVDSVRVRCYAIDRARVADVDDTHIIPDSNLVNDPELRLV